MSPDLTIEFSIVRLAPDPVREEFANIGVLAISPEGMEIRLLDRVPEHFRAIAPPTAIHAIAQLKGALERALTAGEQSLQDLAREDLNGFRLTPPKRRVVDRRNHTLKDEVDTLYREYVEPRRWRTATRTARPTPLEKVIKDRVMARFHTKGLLAVGLTVRMEHLDLSFPLAYANGHATIVQAVDLSSGDKSQETHTEEAISRIAEVNVALAQGQAFRHPPTWISVTRSGAGADHFNGRLKRFSEVIPDDRLDHFTDSIAKESLKPVEQAFHELGFTARRSEFAVEVLAR